MKEIIVQAPPQLFTLENFVFVNLGIFIGIIFGSIPGLNGNLAITVLIPFTFKLGSIPALLMLTAIFFGSNFGGSITAILINTPGTNAAAATLLDGYPLSKKRENEKGSGHGAGSFNLWRPGECSVSSVFCTADQ